MCEALGGSGAKNGPTRQPRTDKNVCPTWRKTMSHESGHESGQCNRDRVIADTGWGIKPDDQPSNTREAGDRACPTYRYDPAEPDVIRKILLAQRRGFNTANRARVEPGRTTILDINGDPVVIEGLTYGDA